MKNPSQSVSSFDSVVLDDKSSNNQKSQISQTQPQEVKKKKYQNNDDSFHSYQLLNPKIAKKMDSCSMCKTHLFKKGLEKFYKCVQCPEMGDKICEGCFHYCHKGHQKIEDTNSSLLTIYDHVCSCAEYDHKVNNVNISGDYVKINETCCFQYINKLLGFNGYMLEINSNKTYCYGCYKMFIHDNKNERCIFDKNPKEFKFIYGELEKCECTKCVSRTKNSKKLPVQMLLYIITSPNEKHFNIRTIFYTIIKEKELKTEFIYPIKSLFEGFRERSSSQMTYDENFNRAENNLLLIKEIMKLYKRIDYDYLIGLKELIGDGFIEFFEKQFYRSFVTINSERINGYKYYALLFVRKFIIYPSTGVKKRIEIYHALANVNPFHRLFDRINKNVFFEKLEPYGISQLFFDKLFDRAIPKTITFFNGDYSFKLIIELIKWFNILMVLDYDDIEEREKYIEKILNKISMIIKLIRVKKLFEEQTEKKKKISYHIQRLFLTCFLYYNDKTLKNLVIEGEGDFESKIEKMKEDGRQLFAFSQEGSNAEENLDLFKINFITKKNDLEIDSSIYDLMINPEDCYVNILKNFIGSKQKFTKLFFEIFNIEDKFQKEINQFKDLIKVSTQIKQFYFNKSISISDFIKEVEKILNESRRQAETIRMSQEETLQFKQIAILQICVVKNGFINNLLSFYEIFNNDIYFNYHLRGVETEEKENRRLLEAKRKILDIFTIFGDNSFVAPLFLSKNTLKSLFAKNEEGMIYIPKEVLKFLFAFLTKIRFIKAKYDYSILLDLIIDHKLYEGDVSNEDDYSKIEDDILFLRLLKLILKINCKETIKKVNEQVYTFISNQDYKHFITCDNFFRFSLPKKMMIVNFVKLLNSLHDYYFLIFQKNYPIKEIKKILENLQKLFGEKINNDIISIGKMHRVFTYAYAKYYFETPFVLYLDDFKDLESEYYRKNGLKFINFENEGIHNLVQKSVVDSSAKNKGGEYLSNDNYTDRNNNDDIINYWKLKPFVENRINNQIHKILLKQKFTENESGKSKKLRNVSFLTLKFILEPMVNNLTKGWDHLIKLESDDKSVFRHFEKVILLPSIHILYSILYYPKAMNAGHKYLVYVVVTLFLNCYRVFLRLIIDKIMQIAKKNNEPEKKEKTFKQSGLNSFKSLRNQDNKDNLEQLIRGCFKLERDEIDIKVWLQSLRDCISLDLESIEKSPLNIQMILKKFTKQTSLLKKTQFLPFLEDGETVFFSFENLEKEKEIVDDSQEKLKEINEFEDNIKQFLDLYSKEKEENNALVEYLQGEHHEQNDYISAILNDIVQKCLNNKINLPFSDYYNFFKAFDLMIIANPDIVQNYILELDEQRKKEDKRKKDENKKKKKENETKKVISEFKEKDNPEANLLISDSIISLITKKLKLLYQIIFIDFHKLEARKNKKAKLYPSIEMFNNLLEFLRLLCENHNQKFQLKLSRFPIEDNFTLLQFLLQIPSLIQENYQIYENRFSTVRFFKQSKYEYFEPLLFKITDFFVELIQGSKTSLLFKISNPYCIIYFDYALICLDNFNLLPNTIFLMEFLKFIVNFFEENAADVKTKFDIIEYFNPSKIISFLVYCTRELYKNIDSIKEREEQLKLENIVKPYHAILLEEYLEHPDKFDECNYFHIACYACKYLHLCGIIGSDKISRLANEYKEIPTEDINLDEETIWKRESFLFFEVIMKEVQVGQRFTYIKPSSEEDHYIDNRFNNIIEIKEDLEGDDDDEEEELNLDDFEDVLQESHKETENSLYESKNNSDSHNDESNEDEEKEEEYINEDKTPITVFLVHSDVLRLQPKDFIRFASTAPYEESIEKLKHLLKYIPKLEQMIQFKKEIATKKNDLIEALSTLNYRFVLQLSAIFSLIVNTVMLFSCYYNRTMLSTSVALIPYERYSNILFYLNLLHLIFLFSVFANWFYFRDFTLLYAKKVDKIDRWLVIERFLFHDFYVSLLFWNFFWGIIALLYSGFHFAYSLQLFCIFGLFETMTTVLTSVQVRGTQFFSAGLLILILSIFFTAIKFYWFCDPTTDECNRFLYCYLTMITGGIRAGAGLNLSMKSIADKGYFSELTIEWIFYFTIILVMLNIINGIIVDTFQEQREEQNERNDAQLNKCYICNVERQTVEKEGDNFKYHNEVKHSYINYFQYLLSIRKTNAQDLNSLDFSICDKIEKERTDFFPKSKDYVPGEK